MPSNPTQNTLEYQEPIPRIERVKTFVIAEAGVNHNGDEALALELVAAAAHSGADAVKFQTFSADLLVTPGADKADYQIRQTGKGDQHAMLKALEMSESMHRTIFARCAKAGIEFMSTPFDETSADFLIKLGMSRIKIASGEITNHNFLRYLARKGAPMILSTGMSSLDEVLQAVRVIADEWNSYFPHTALDKTLTILHCTSNYPTKLEDVNLRAMTTIHRETGIAVGYSDHTLGSVASTTAVALGATVIEKHLTLDRNLPGPDHSTSLNPEEFAEMVRQIRNVETVLGSTVKQPVPDEIAVRDLVRRSLTSVREIRQGALICADDIAVRRPGNGIPAYEYETIIGRSAIRDLPPGTTLQWTDLK
jgi:N,N'-diacetyllegionaminate synthase